MTRPSWTRLILLAAVATCSLATGSAHAFSKTVGLASFPASGKNAGKYAKAWMDLSVDNCAITNSVIPACLKANASLSGKLLNAEIQAVSGQANVQKTLLGNDALWSWSYQVQIFGTTIASPGGSVWQSQAIVNGLTGQPIVDDRSPVIAKGQKNISLDLSQINSSLSILPDAVITINYNLNAGVITQIDVMPVSGYGSLVPNVLVKPHGSMTASGSTSYSAGPVRARVFTQGNVQVVAPNSDLSLNGSYSFDSHNANLTMTPNLRLLKGEVSYGIDGWLNPAGQIADTATAIGCGIASIFGASCSGTSFAWEEVASGDIWNQTSSYLLYLNSGQVTSLFSGQLPPLQ